MAHFAGHSEYGLFEKGGEYRGPICEVNIFRSIMIFVNFFTLVLAVLTNISYHRVATVMVMDTNRCIATIINQINP